MQHTAWQSDSPFQSNVSLQRFISLDTQVATLSELPKVHEAQLLGVGNVCEQLC